MCEQLAQGRYVELKRPGVVIIAIRKSLMTRLSHFDTLSRQSSCLGSLSPTQAVLVVHDV